MAGAQSPVQRGTPKRRDAERLMWERTMRRLRVSTRLLAAVLLALLVRMLAIGANLLLGLTAVVVAALLLGSLLITSQGRRLEPRRPRRG
jgi:hypothetical protein